MTSIKRLREEILMNRVRVDEYDDVVRETPPKVSRPKQTTSGSKTRTSSPLERKPSIEGHDEEAATRAWMENLEHFDHGPMCSYCGKTFERTAVLKTHRLTCVQRIRQMENGSASVPLPSKARSSSARRRKVKGLLNDLEMKKEPVDSMPASSDDSNSNDVSLAALQTRDSPDTKEDRVLTIKPEELALLNCTDENRRKRKKPTIMLRNANDDISFELDESEQSSMCKNEEFTVPVENGLKKYAVTVQLVPKVKRKPRNRKKLPPEEELSEKEMNESLAVSGKIVCRCSKSFDDPVKYKRHVRVFHNRQRRFWCAICDFKGYRKVDTINHLLQVC